jgi:hypothetical protein
MTQLVKIPGGTFEEQGHRYCDETGQRLLSVTSLFESLGMIDYAGASEAVLQWKSELGVAVHSGIEYLTEGTLDWDTVDENAMPYIMSFEDWARESGYVSTGREQQGILTIHGMKCGYRYDNIGTMIYKGRKRWVMLELKNTVKSSPTWKIQTAAYTIPAPKLENGEQYLRCALQLRPDAPAIPHYYEDAEDARSFAHFLYCGIWKLNNGFKLK